MAEKAKTNDVTATNDPAMEMDTSKATDAEIQKVLDAVHNGDSIPAGFVFDPHGKEPVRRLKD